MVSFSSHIDFINTTVRTVKSRKSSILEFSCEVEGRDVFLEVKGYFVFVYKVEGEEYITYTDLLAQEFKHELARPFLMEYLDE